MARNVPPAGEHISDASLSLDDLRRARIVFQFAAKAENLHVNAAIEHVFVDSGSLQKMLSVKRPLRSVEEGDKKRISPLVNATSAPVGSVSFRVRRLSRQPENR